MLGWLTQLQALAETHAPCVLITVAAVAGSTPRECGAKMIITEQSSHGTIGGGNLEYKAIECARELLAGTASQAIERMPLGPALDQCCGGVALLYLEKIEYPYPEWITAAVKCVMAERPAILVSVIDEQSEKAPADKWLVTDDAHRCDHHTSEHETVAIERARSMLQTADVPAQVHIDPAESSPRFLYEPLQPTAFNIALFGAGHVGRAVARVLADITCRLHWIDSRSDQFPSVLPGDVNAVVTETPTQVLETLPADTYYLVMTHSHPLDQALCEQILRRGEFAFLGLIGSQTKRNRFEKRLRQRGLSRNQLARLTCPIGVPGIDAKYPGAIAIAAVAQLLQIHQSQAAVETSIESSLAYR